ncbi:uncharacterized protein LOC127279925 [Leptopilina boulardi]|uniref:uncharacterized protein LOC127279925 n=1 Tax=Leptopilina boulardi TaxID=63433 RepID=UPI0021F58FAD|nr:uncharacterized protein LOC127279925 [Leptopilina boulardi]
MEKASPRMEEIAEKYPRLFDYSGEMINEEYKLIFDSKVSENGKIFLSRFPTWATPRILHYCKERRPDIFKKASIVKDGRKRFDKSDRKCADCFKGYSPTVHSLCSSAESRKVLYCWRWETYKC